MPSKKITYMTKAKKTVKFTKKENQLYKEKLCFSFDEAYAIMNEDGEQIGLIFLSQMQDGSIYIEWVEIMTVFRGQGYLRAIFAELNHMAYPSKGIQLECSDELVRKYQSIGCIKQGDDDCTELAVLSYPVSKEQELDRIYKLYERMYLDICDSNEVKFFNRDKDVEPIIYCSTTEEKIGGYRKAVKEIFAHAVNTCGISQESLFQTYPDLREII